MSDETTNSNHTAPPVVQGVVMSASSTTTGKKAVTTKDAWDMQDMKKDLPHGWIQWKGTDVCMDVCCACGHLSHIDADFTYHVKCPECGRVYFCNGHIEFIELEVEPENCVVTGE